MLPILQLNSRYFDYLIKNNIFYQYVIDQGKF